MKRIYIFHLSVLLMAISLNTKGMGSTEVSPDSLGLGKVQPIDLIEFSFELERVEKYFKKMESNLIPDTRIAKIDSTFRDYKAFLENEAREFKMYNPYNLSRFFLENAYRLWEGFSGKLIVWQQEANTRLKVIQTEIAELEKIRVTWELTLSSNQLSGEPEEVQARIRKILNQAEYYRVTLGKQKWQYIILADEIAGMDVFCDGIITQITQLQQNQRDSLFIAVSPALWEVTIQRGDYLPVKEKLNKARHENAKIIRNYFQTQSLSSFWIAAFIIVLFFFWMRRRYLRRNFDDSHPGHKNIVRIFASHPFLTITSLVLVTFHLMFPFYPLVLNHILTLILLLNMRFILSNFIDREDKNFIFKLVILLLINDAEIIFWYFRDVARYYILLEAIIGIAIALPFLKPANRKKLYRGTNIKRIKLLLVIIIATFYLISLISNLFGYLNLAVLITKVGIHVPEFTVVLFGIYKIVIAFIRSTISVWSTGKNQILSGYWDNIEKRAIRVAGILAVIYWFFSLTVSFEVSRVIFESMWEFLSAERTVGTMQLTIGSILALILILAVTFIITGILKVVIEHILLKNIGLPRGVPAAISVTIRYFLVILGFMFALSAAGIELGKFSLLAGALGVGIGFGLQNIVNNFISGLILVYERPLQVGDTIEVDDLLGQVNRIGIRSSNVRTYDGAEVVVPNGNLVSNQLINWTLSDNKRRIEVKVGVSYGSDPNVVLVLLENVAANHEDVLKDPPPWALFDGFGDSSLNFRLLFWVPYEIGTQTKSAVAIGIFNTFRENGILIPFPQLDLHVKKEQEPLSEDEIRAMKSMRKNSENKTGSVPQNDPGL